MRTSGAAVVVAPVRRWRRMSISICFRSGERMSAFETTDAKWYRDQTRPEAIEAHRRVAEFHNAIRASRKQRSIEQTCSVTARNLPARRSQPIERAPSFSVVARLLLRMLATFVAALG